jgi:RNA polymerase sigma factor (sigma-70 family)
MNRKLKDDRLQEAIIEQACGWFVRHRAGELPQAEKETFLEWLRASKANMQEYLELLRLRGLVSETLGSLKLNRAELLQRAQEELSRNIVSATAEPVSAEYVRKGRQFLRRRPIARARHAAFSGSAALMATTEADQCENWFTAVYEQFANSMKKTARSRGASRADAEDDVHEAFIKVWALTKAGIEVLKQQNFLSNLVRNVGVDRHRRDHGDVRVDVAIESLGLASLEPTLEEQAVADEKLQRIVKILESEVNPQTAEIFLSHRVHGVPCARIAELRGISVGKVYDEIAKALCILERFLPDDRD